jgi:small-conductance mechanosensitive channel
VPTATTGWHIRPIPLDCSDLSALFGLNEIIEDPLSQFNQLMAVLGQDFRTPSFMWQVGIAVFGIAAAWLIAHRFTPKFDGGVTLHGGATGWRLGRGSLNRIAFPLLAFIFIAVGKVFLSRVQHTEILNIILTLLTSFVLVRLAVYMLRTILPPSQFLKGSERFIAIVLWGGVALYITGLHEPIVQFLEEIQIPIGRQHLSLLVLIQGVSSVIVALVISLWLGQLVETRVMGAMTLSAGLRVVLAKFVRALSIVLALLIGLSIMNIDLTVLSVFGGALGVGLGFGLQKIASNYVSGFIILLDRSIRPGDMITVDNRTGVVSQLNARYTVVKALDGTEAIIPNDTLMSTTVINQSYTDNRVLTKLSLQVSYQSPIDEALSILRQAAAKYPRVLKDPGPAAQIQEFGDNGITLDLLFWIADPENGQGQLKSDIFLAIWKAFQAAGIEIPYPQREVRVVNSAPPLDTAELNTAAASAIDQIRPG